jgi:hypothetical protein
MESKTPEKIEVEDNVTEFRWRGEENHARSLFKVVTTVITIRMAYLSDICLEH